MNKFATVIVATLIAASSALTFAAPAKAFTCYRNPPPFANTVTCQ